jgi:hypothetical protein
VHQPEAAGTNPSVHTAARAEVPEAAVGRMFPELLRDIFRYVAHGTGVTAMESPGCSRNIQRLTWVCKLWRAVALGDAELWTTIMNPRGRGLPRLLARAQGRPLHIGYSDRIACVSSTPPPDHITSVSNKSPLLMKSTRQANIPDVLIRPLSIIQPHMRWIATLSLEAEAHMLDKMVSGLFIPSYGEAYLLQRLAIVLWESEPLDLSQSARSAAASVRGVTSLTLAVKSKTYQSEGEIEFVPSSLGMNRHRRKVPSLFETHRTLMLFLALFPALRHLELSHIIEHPHDHVGEPPLSLASLESLTIHEEASSITALFQCLKAPSLNHLHVTVAGSLREEAASFSGILLQVLTDILARHTPSKLTLRPDNQGVTIILHSGDRCGPTDDPLFELCFNNAVSAQAFAESTDASILRGYVSGQEVHIHETQQKELVEPLAALLALFVPFSNSLHVHGTSHGEGGVIARARAWPEFVKLWERCMHDPQ